MKCISFAATVAAVGLLMAESQAVNWTQGFSKGTPEVKSISQLAFGPAGVLFVADSRSAAVVAVDTGDNKEAPAAPVKVENVHAKVAALLGTSADQVIISDVAVNPVSRKVYLAVSRGRGPDAKPALVRVDGGNNLELVKLEGVNHSRVELPKAPIDREPAAGGRGGNPRLESITDIAFLGDRVLIAGLSNEEFSSSMRAIPFPFEKGIEPTSVEIFHGAHGKYETHAPIRTFVPMKIGDETQLLAAYTCTPLVQVPLKELQPSAKVKGKTVAELGNRNRPIDMIVYQKGGKDYILMANSARGVMKIAADSLPGAEEINTPVREEKKGVGYETIASLTGIEQLDKLDNAQAVVLRKTEAGHNLEAVQLP